MKYEYMKTNLNAVSDRMTDIDVMNQAGQDGWKLVSVSQHYIGYFMREVVEPKKAKPKG